MSFRARLTVAAAIAVAIAVASACGAAYLVVRDELRGEIDDSLSNRVEAVLSRPIGPDFLDHENPPQLPQPRFGGPSGYAQLVTASGRVIAPRAATVTIPADKNARAVAAGDRDAYFSDMNVSGTHLRVLTNPFVPGLALQVARPLDEVDRSLHRLGIVLLLIAGGGTGLAAMLGLVVARTATAPVRRMSETAAHVAETRDLTRRVQAGGRDELSRLAESFNTMLGALEDSLRSQRQLVADASHELRTPLTSLRTNLEVLARDEELPPGDRQQLLRDLVAQIEELTELVADVVELAREREPELEAEDVQLDVLVGDVVERMRRHAPDVAFELDAEPTLVHGVPSRIERAVANLLDNAAKWSPPDRPVEVTVRGTEVAVRDYGPGIDAEDLPFVFDRFYRARSARGMPGSGLGLAIVRRIAELHGGTATVEAAEGGGSRFRLTLA